MFLNISRISASNDFKMFLNIIVSNGCTFFPSTQNKKGTDYKHVFNLFIHRYHRRQRKNCKNKFKKGLKRKLHMHNTI